MLNRKLIIVPLLAVALVLSGFSCHKAATVSRGVAASLVALQDSEITLHNQGLITADEHVTLQQGFLAFAQTGQQVNKCIGSGGASGCVDPAIAALDNFIASPVAGIKNPNSKQAITLAAQALEAALVTLKGAL